MLEFDTMRGEGKNYTGNIKMKTLMVRQAKLGRANRMKGVCTAKKTKCR